MKYGLLIKIASNVKLKIMLYDTTNNWVDIIKMRYSVEPKYEKYVEVYGFLYCNKNKNRY